MHLQDFQHVPHLKNLHLTLLEKSLSSHKLLTQSLCQIRNNFADGRTLYKKKKITENFWFWFVFKRENFHPTKVFDQSKHDSYKSC
jgi:hypothetical protein